MRSIFFHLGSLPISDWIGSLQPQKLIRECAIKTGTKHVDRNGDLKTGACSKMTIFRVVQVKPYFFNNL